MGNTHLDGILALADAPYFEVPPHGEISKHLRDGQQMLTTTGSSAIKADGSPVLFADTLLLLPSPAPAAAATAAGRLLNLSSAIDHHFCLLPLLAGLLLAPWPACLLACLLLAPWLS